MWVRAFTSRGQNLSLGTPGPSGASGRQRRREPEVSAHPSGSSRPYSMGIWTDPGLTLQPRPWVIKTSLTAVQEPGGRGCSLGSAQTHLSGNCGESEGTEPLGPASPSSLSSSWQPGCIAILPRGQIHGTFLPPCLKLLMCVPCEMFNRLGVTKGRKTVGCCFI